MLVAGLAAFALVRFSFKGKALEYSHANARKLLAIKDFRKAVAQFADDVSAFKFKETEEQGKA